MMKQLNIITKRIEFFKEHLDKSNFNLIFNDALDLHKYCIIDTKELASNFDNQLYIGNALYFIDSKNLKNCKNELLGLNPDCTLIYHQKDFKNDVLAWIEFIDNSKSQVEEILIFKKVFTESIEINDIIEKYSKEIPFQSLQTQNNFETVAWELLQNAFFNSPIDEKGNPLYRFNNRDINVKLPNSPVEIIVSLEGEYIKISVTDNFGTLLAQTVKNYLFREIISVREGQTGGAGVGLNMIENSSNHIFVAVNQEKSTRFTVKIKNTARNLDFLSTNKLITMKEEFHEC